MARISTRPHRRTQLARGLGVGAAIALFATACTAAVSPPTTVPPTTVPPTTVPPTIPPASSVLYDSNATGNFEIYRRNLQTGVATQLTNDRRFDSWWTKPSPDGTRIALLPHTGRRTRHRLQADQSLDGEHRWKRAPAGDRQRPVRLGRAGPCRVVSRWHQARDVRRKRLQRHRRHRHQRGAAAPGRQRHRSRVELEREADHLHQLRQGRRLPVCPADQNRVWAVNEDGSSPHMLVDIPVGANDPTMSPDGTTIAFETNPGGFVWDLWVANADGSNPRQALLGRERQLESGLGLQRRAVLLQDRAVPERVPGLHDPQGRKRLDVGVAPGQVGIAEMAVPRRREICAPSTQATPGDFRRHFDIAASARGASIAG